MNLRPLLAITLLFGCGSCEDDNPPPVPSVNNSPADAPEDLVGEVYSAGDAISVESAASFRSLVHSFVALPTEVTSLETDLLRAVLLRGDERAVAVHLPAGLNLRTSAGAPRGTRWIGEGRSAALFERTLVVASSPEALEKSLPYVLFGTPPEASGSAVARFAPGEAGRTLRPLATLFWAGYVSQGRALIAHERETRPEPPDFGDPEAMLEALDEFVQGTLAWLPDLGEIRVSYRIESWGNRLTIDADVVPDSPLAGWLQTTDANRSGSERDLGALPSDAALAVWRATPFDWPGLLNRVGGDRVQTPLRGPGSHLVALGGGDRGAWLRFGAGPDGTPPVERLMGDYRSTVFGAAFGCARPSLRPGAEVCPATEERAAVRLDSTAVEFVRGRREEATLSSVPDAARLLPPGSPLFTLYFNAGAVSPAAALFRAPVPPLDDKPFVFWIAKDGEALHLELRATPGALDPIVALIAEI